jgi:uncharacterized membrane protein
MAVATSPAPKFRFESIDIVRGLVMLIMAIDHVRDLFHAGHPDPTDLAVTTPILFFTRWITHFCAPTFVFLSGISAFLAGTRRTRKQLSSFLITRGLWLIVVEVVLITFAITLNPFYNVLVLQVIWVIGGSMVILGILVRFKAPLAFIAVLGGLIFCCHNLPDIMNFGAITKTFLWRLLLSAGGFNALWPLGDNRFLLIAYALLPWTGVMLLGYVCGATYKYSFHPGKRRKILLNSGLLMLLVFGVFRYYNIYGDPSPWAVQKTTELSIISFLDVTKYPCSLLYLCMTLGTALVLLALTENVKNKFTSILIIYGNVPFFYYLCHWYLIRFINVALFFAMNYKTDQIVNPKQPLLFQPDGFAFNLFGVYMVWLIVIFALYFPCRWYSRYKKTHRQWWLSYI